MKQKRKASKHKQVTANDLLFISDASLRKKVIDAIETISGLYLVEKDKNYPSALNREIRRVIVLYSASIIEAVLLYLYNKEKVDFQKIEYKDVHRLPTPYQLESDAKLVIAKQISKPRNERELMLDVLLKVFVDRKIIPQKLENKIKKAKDIRNTFHLSKSRAGLVVSSNTVETATDAVYETIVCVRVHLKS